MRTILICHEDAGLHREGMARWLASFSTLAGIVVLREERRATWRRARRELRRVGVRRFADVVAFRLYYKLFLAAKDERWKARALRSTCDAYAPIPDDTPIIRAASPNTPEVARFVRDASPHIMLALCKVLLRPDIFSIPSDGTFALHPGICPEYRNAHGCFWALANDDVSKVGMSLVRIDAGVDTGPVYGYYSYPYDEQSESHTVIQHRVVLENLDILRDKLAAIHAGQVMPLDTAGRMSAAWGQPWLTSYVKWRYKAKKRRIDASYRAALS